RARRRAAPRAREVQREGRALPRAPRTHPRLGDVQPARARGRVGRLVRGPPRPRHARVSRLLGAHALAPPAPHHGRPAAPDALRRRRPPGRRARRALLRGPAAHPRRRALARLPRRRLGLLARARRKPRCRRLPSTGMSRPSASGRNAVPPASPDLPSVDLSAYEPSKSPYLEGGYAPVAREI